MEHDLWNETVKRYNARQEEGLLWQRLHYHEALVRAHSATFELLIGRHKREVERLEGLLGISEPRLAKPGEDVA